MSGTKGKPANVKILESMVLWKGYYGRISGNKTSGFFIRYINNKWWPVTILNTNSYEQIECLAEECKAANDLAKAVNAAKHKMTQTRGGSFIINEFGQIIVPNSRGNGERMYVGILEGDLRFKDASTGKYFSFNDDSGLKTGDLWKKPYIGTMYHLSKYKEIYAWIDNSDGQMREKPSIQDEKLIKKLLAIRGSGGVRFIVNHHGIVLTKKEFAFKDWRPVYVGRVDYDRWFKKGG